MSKRVLEGVVVSVSSCKTIKVLVSTVMRHKIYKKVIKKMKKYMVHDELNRYKCGDLVTIQESRPISATKRWVVIYN